MNGGKWNAQLNIGCKEDALGFLKVFFLSSHNHDHRKGHRGIQALGLIKRHLE